jgi:uncharacterized protein YjgD (DUF1641 family)
MIKLQNITDIQQQKIEQYIELLMKWNRVFKLTAITAKDDIIDKIRFFLENKPELTRIGNNAYNSVIENFSVNEQNVEIIDNIYSVDYETENAE